MTFAGLLLLALIIWFWRDTMRARETANRICADTCENLGVQFLDDTVALRRLRLRRDAGGPLRISRIYAFEYSDTGHNRRRGTIVMTGGRLELFHMEGSEDIH